MRIATIVHYALRIMHGNYRAVVPNECCIFSAPSKMSGPPSDLEGVRGNIWGWGEYVLPSQLH